MTVLSGELRKVLSDVVVAARDVVELACEQRIASLGVAAEKAPNALTDEERAVRVGLRARARQLGSVDALVTEAGFEHWHRMLFARFLADNNLLVDEQFGQPLTISEVAEYAAEAGEADPWEVAARFAAAMLPGIFLQDDPILAMRLPVETRQELERLLDLLPAEVITAEDSLGWVYQYWQSRRKDEVNKSERKIGGADLAPVTQLFTENYMVRFLLENSLGAWWAVRHPDSPLLAEWEYLRRNEDGSPAVVGFEGWPDRVADVTVMDPCCGSGHFLVAAFGMLWRMRAEEEGLDPVAAQDAVLRDNLYGLELDARCTQIAIFALALDAWKEGGYRELPLPNVACCGIPARAPLSDWLDLADGDPQVEAALTRLHALFAHADTLGSLIDPVRAAEQAGLESVDWADVAPLVLKALTAETRHQVADPAAVFGHAAVGIARAADYLSRKYTLVCTNPPWLGLQGAHAWLNDFLVTEYPSSSQDLATVFLERGVRLVEGGSIAFVTPLNWLFLKYYRDLRRRLISELQWNLLVPLGKGAFGAISGEVVQGALVVMSRHRLEIDTAFVDATKAVGALGKEGLLREAIPILVERSRLREESERLLALGTPGGKPLSLHADSWQGLVTSDAPRFIVKFWELPAISPDWERYVSAPSETADFTGRQQLVQWGKGSGFMVRESGAHNFNPLNVLGKKGVLVAQGSLKVTLYWGEMFNHASAPVMPKNDADLAAIWSFLQTDEFRTGVRQINQKVIVDPGYLLKVPFDIDLWRERAELQFPDGLPEPFSDDPTQWLFWGGVVGSRFPLQVAVARLVEFRWPDQAPDAVDALADVDGVVCLPAVGGESTAEERLRGVLAAAFGDSWAAQTLDGLLVEAGGKAGAGGLERWLRDGFFKDHCKVFANRPFIWQIWDGRADGFSALVNYHKLDRKLLERLTHDYLGSWWIGRLTDEVRQGLPGGEARLVAAEALKAKLQLILDGEAPYDIFVRWKSLAEQAIGWEPDLDDGVRMNIRPFVTAGVLRAKPNIKWDKDRGKNPDGSERLNDLHFTLAQKRTARGVAP